MKKDFNFTQSFAMKCDAEQFESVKNELEGMGYQRMYDYQKGFLCTNYNRENYLFGLAPRNEYFQKLLIETFNRDLCLALAAMTDRKKPIVGEWIVAIKEARDITEGKLYKVVEHGEYDDENVHYAHIIDDGNLLHHFTKNFFKDNFRKATADELINYFTNEKPFVLPENWYCPYENREQFEVMNNYFRKYWLYFNADGFYGCSNDESNNNWNNYFVTKNKTKITFDQFMKYVVEPNKNKKMETKEQDLRTLLETGDIVEMRNGTQCKVLKDVNTETFMNQGFILISDAGRVYMIKESYDRNLITERDNTNYDIMKIWSKYSDRGILFIEKKGALKWERPEEVETVKMTVAEVSKLVGKRVEIIEG